VISYFANKITHIMHRDFCFYADRGVGVCFAFNKSSVNAGIDSPFVKGACGATHLDSSAGSE
jgi:hypothetical protein